jgi:hypothetical protein
MELGSLKTKCQLLICGTLLGVFVIPLFLSNRLVSAATGINQEINFQGRLLNSQGATVPDGYYNIEFKIYQDGDGQSAGDATGSPSGSLKWTEDYLNNNSQGVQVVNGYLSVELGSINPFGSSINWNQSTLWLSMNIAGTGTGGSCSTFSSCGPDGEMTPMQPLTTAIYSFNSLELGGLTASSFGQLASSQTWSGANAFQTTTNSLNALQVLTSLGNSVLNVDTSNQRVGIGITGTASQLLAVGGTTGNLTVDTSGNLYTTGNLSATGYVVSVGVNSGTGLLQGTGVAVILVLVQVLIPEQ